MHRFVNLHVKSHYSILQSVPTIDELIKAAKELNQSCLALTDMNNMYAVPEFCKKALQENLKPIFGIELEVMAQSRFSPQRKDDPPISKYSIILLAKSFQGYENLLKISSLGYDDGYFGRFCVDRMLLSKYNKGLIVLSSDHTGEIWQHVFEKNYVALEKTVSFFQTTFGKENFFIELQDRGISDDKIVNKILIDYAQKNNIPLVATNPVKYIKSEDCKLLSIASCIREKKLLSEKNTSSIGPSYFKSAEEMYALFGEIPEALENSVKIADSCNVVFPEIKDQSPIYPIPNGSTASDFLRQKSLNELIKKFNNKLPQNYEQRLNWELDMVCAMGFPNYFLVVSDFVQYAKKIGILVGPGRGSAAGALLSYALDITTVDPLKYDLLFERFLNPERISLPDIDIDFEDERRDEVKQYLRTQYGSHKTADVVTFGYNKAKAVLKDVGRVLEISLPRVNYIVNIVDANEDLAIQIEKIPELKSIMESNNLKEKEWIQCAVKLANRIRNLSTHASALIIAQNDLKTVIPLFKDKSNTTVTAFEGKYLEENGLLKMDILGLSNLSIIQHCLHNIYQNHQHLIQIEKIPLDDPKVFEMFTLGHTAGIFQFESSGMTNYIKQLKPTCIEDLIAMNALYRPGPMDSIPSFIKRKHGLEPIDCFHEKLEPILKNTYGIIVYQEQVMQIAQILSGFSLGEADIIRRIMAKKQPHELETVRPKWIEGAIIQGYERSLAEHLFDLLIPFSNYAFNKSHAVAYSILAYQIAWLKTHYPAEFMTSLLNANMNRHEDLSRYITEASKLNISIFMPDINKSSFTFQSEKLINKHNQEILGIRYGFGAIKGLGEQASQEIVTERSWGGKYLSIEDFIERTQHYNDIRKSAIEILLKSAAFDSFFSKEQILNEKAIYLNSKNINILYNKFDKKDCKNNAVSLFSLEEMDAASDSIQRSNIPALSFEEDFKNELKVFGFYLSQKLFIKINQLFGKLSCFEDSLKDILPINSYVSLVGYPSDIYIQDNQNTYKSWGKFILHTELDTITFFVFGEKLSLLKILKEGVFLFVKAKIITRKEKRAYELEDISLISETTPSPHYTSLTIFLRNAPRSENIDSVLTNLQKISHDAYRNNAHHNLRFYVAKASNISILEAPQKFRIHFPDPHLQQILEHPLFLSYWCV